MDLLSDYKKAGEDAFPLLPKGCGPDLLYAALVEGVDFTLQTQATRLLDVKLLGVRHLARVQLAFRNNLDVEFRGYLWKITAIDQRTTTNVTMLGVRL